MDKIVWQPTYLHTRGYEFNILLDWEFAEKMIGITLSDDFRDRLNEYGAKVVKEKGHSWLSPYQFYEDTAFVDQFSLGENGVWLAADTTSGRSPLEVFKKPNPIKFSSHNVDHSSHGYTLKALVDMWIYYSDVFKDFQKN